MLSSKSIFIFFVENFICHQKKLDKMIKTNKIPEICGWVGMILIHGATAPTSISVLMGWSTNLPPLN